jgi:tRNA (cytidine32/uridine32-2'-O)-methyltransferase
MLEQVRVVLVETSHPGNIGAVARAMKTMDLKHLYLVSPKHFPDPQATAMASNADDILDNCHVVDSLAQAIGDCQYVYGCTARARDLQWPMRSAEECALEVKAHAQVGAKVAVVFGRESTGLSNDELWLCQAGVTIPTSQTYRSLNLAQAVQLIAYELFKHQSDTKSQMVADETVTHDALELFFVHLQKVLIDIEFMQADEPKRLMPKLRRLFNRASIQVSEMNILRGILTQIEKMRAK